MPLKIRDLENLKSYHEGRIREVGLGERDVAPIIPLVLARFQTCYQATVHGAAQPQKKQFIAI
jgi:hypothetical protein